MIYYAEVCRVSPCGATQGYVVKRRSDGKTLSHEFQPIWGIDEDDEDFYSQIEVYTITDAERDANIACDSINEAYEVGTRK